MFDSISTLAVRVRSSPSTVMVIRRALLMLCGGSRALRVRPSRCGMRSHGSPAARYSPLFRSRTASQRTELKRYCSIASERLFAS